MIPCWQQIGSIAIDFWQAFVTSRNRNALTFKRTDQYSGNVTLTNSSSVVDASFYNMGDRVMADYAIYAGEEVPGAVGQNRSGYARCRMFALANANGRFYRIKSKLASFILLLTERRPSALLRNTSQDGCPKANKALVQPSEVGIALNQPWPVGSLGSRFLARAPQPLSMSRRGLEVGPRLAGGKGISGAAVSSLHGCYRNIIASNSSPTDHLAR
jgi:hypothetical protein